MKVVQATDADKALLRKTIEEVTLPKWAARCTDECIKSFNETIGKAVGIVAKK